MFQWLLLCSCVQQTSCCLGLCIIGCIEGPGAVLPAYCKMQCLPLHERDLRCYDKNTEHHQECRPLRHAAPTAVALRRSFVCQSVLSQTPAKFAKGNKEPFLGLAKAWRREPPTHRHPNEPCHSSLTSCPCRSNHIHRPQPKTKIMPSPQKAVQKACMITLATSVYCQAQDPWGSAECTEPVPAWRLLKTSASNVVPCLISQWLANYGQIAPIASVCPVLSKAHAQNSVSRLSTPHLSRGNSVAEVHRSAARPGR